MSALQYQFISSEGHIPTNQEMGPTTGPLDNYPLKEEFLQSISFDTNYNGNWLTNMQNMQPSGQIHQASVDYSLNNPPDMEPAGEFTEAFLDPNLNIPTQVQSYWQYPEAFGDQSYNIPTHMQLAGQPTLNSHNQNSNTYTNIQDLGQSTANLANQSSYDPTNTHPLEQHTQAPINYSGNTAAIVPFDGQATQPTLHYSGNPHTNAPLDGQATQPTLPYDGNLQTNTPLDGQATPAPVPSSGNPQTDAPLDGHAIPAPGPSSGNGNKKTRTSGKSSPVPTNGKVKHPAVVEDKDIERCAREYDIPYADTRILLDYANARVKGIETSEPRDAPSRYIISRYEQVRRTYPDQATWPYDLPKEKIIRLLPGQQRQDRAPHKSYEGACEKRRQELDDRYNESRQWEGPPPPKPDETQQDTLIDLPIDSIATESTAPSNFESAEVADNTIATGLTPPPNFDSAELANEVIALGSPSSWNFDTPEETEAFTKMLQASIQSLDNTTSAPSFDFGMEGIEGPFQLPQQPPFTVPIQPAGLEPQNYLAYASAAPEDIHMAGSGEPAQFPSLLPTFTPMEQHSRDLLENSNIPAAFDVRQCKNPLAPLTFTPMEQDSLGPLDNSHPPAGSDDDDFNSLFDDEEQSPSLQPTSPPTEQDNTGPSANTGSSANANPAAESADSPLGSLFEEPLELINNYEMVQQPVDPAQHPSAVPTFTPMEQDGIIPLDNLYLPAVSNDSPYGSLLDKQFQFMDDTEFNMLMQSFEGGSGDIGMEGLAMEM